MAKNLKKQAFKVVFYDIFDVIISERDVFACDRKEAITIANGNSPDGTAYMSVKGIN